MAGVEQQGAEAAAGAQGAATTIPVVNPATGEVVATVPQAGADEVREIVERARRVQPGWEALGFQERGRILLRAQKWVIDQRERIIDAIVSETGKTYEDALAAEVAYAAHALGFWARSAPRYLADERVRSSSMLVKGRRLAVRWRPLGVVGVIGPWNYPLTNSFGDCIPALAAGNAVVLKPSEITPLTSLVMRECMEACGLPPDVFAVAIGAGDTGRAVVDEVDMVMFTGSTGTGRQVAIRAAERLIPCSLELGGKDPMIVLRDADLERAANVAVFYAMQNGGQTCIAVERVYVEAPVHDEFVAKVRDKVVALRQGPSGGPGTAEVGAVTFPPQLDIIERQVADAIAKGARVLVGGRRREGSGMFFEPTVIDDATQEMAVMTEETFGPTLPIMKVRDAEEAIRLANDSIYGLGGSVFTKDLARGESIARRLRSGAVCVNDAAINYVALELPMGGAKQSGLGQRHGAGGIRKYCEPQTIVVSRGFPRRDMHMFPYTARGTKRVVAVLKLLYGRGRRG
ncbi:MAG: aldehyde dehydrogenase family protein [Solirubrobacteraceae bacterium]|nr:aldehyde dehydrogenase family protein [Solirubrobacteraceae bacterium]